jgi:Single cache domain 3
MVLAFVLLFAGVYWGLHGDLSTLASQQVKAGDDALQAALAARSDAIRSAVLQAAAQQRFEDALGHHDQSDLRDLSRDLALSAGLSFVVVLGPDGKVVAGNLTKAGVAPLDAAAQNASMGSMVSGLALIPPREITALAGRPSSAAELAIVTASPVNVAGRTIGVLYAGQFIDAGTQAVADVGRFTGGEAAIVYSGQIASTSITGKDGAPLLGLSVPDSNVVAGRTDFDGRQTLHDVEYFARISPLTDYNGNVIGAYWFGVPYARFEALANHTLAIVGFWALVGVVIAVGFGVFIADRLGKAIARRSRQVNESAKELRILVVGGEVSEDHVGQTREKLERIEALADRLGDTEHPTDVGHLRRLAAEAVGDVTVIDTLTTELSTRLQDAATRVERLGEVARALDILVAGRGPSRN